MTWTVETWMRQRGTWPTTPTVLVRDLGLRPDTASMALRRLAATGMAIPVAPSAYVHRDYLPKDPTMSTLILLGPDGAERHRADFPSRVRADIAQRIVDADLRAGRTEVRIVGADPTEPLYRVSGVARAMVQPTPLPAPVDADTTAFDARSRAAGDDR